MKVYVGADHRGHNLKREVVHILKTEGCRVVDLGTHDESISCDYPKIAHEVATRVARSKHARGVLICLSGIGQTIAANKVRGAYAALCYNAQAAALSRQHNNANILVLGAKFVRPKEVPIILKTWLETKFEGGRHLRRFKQIKKIERK